jgi:hypothetical protein
LFSNDTFHCLSIRIDMNIQIFYQRIKLYLHPFSTKKFFKGVTKVSYWLYLGNTRHEKSFIPSIA